MKDFDPKTGTFAKIEKRDRRCLMPYEIQSCFDLPTLKEAYEIPENDVAQSVHNQRLRGMFKELNLAPKKGDISVLNPEEVHSFDEQVREVDREGKIDLRFRGSRLKRRAIDDLE